MQSVKSVSRVLLFLSFAQSAQANVVGSEHQNFSPSLSMVDVASVHTGRTVGRGRLGLGLFVNTAVNTLPYFNQEETDNRDRRKNLNDTITILDLNLVYGILDGWDISLAAPYIIQQSLQEDNQLHGYFSRLGHTELRLSTKVALASFWNVDLAALGHANYNRVEDNPYTGDVDWPSLSLEVAATMDFGLVDWSVNAGYRWHRGEADPELQAKLPIKPIGDQWLASTAVTLDIPATDLDIVGEIYGTYARQDFSAFSPRNPSVLEGLAGVRYPLGPDWQLHAGAGAEMRHAVSSADFRAYVGVRWMTDTRRHEIPLPAVTPAPTAPQPVFMSISDLNPDAVFELEDVYFYFDSTAIRDPKGYEILEKLTAALKEKPIERVVIEGHACAMGSDDYNFALSDRRAESIERWLIQNQGIAPEKLVTVGWGERKPKMSNAVESSRMMNRRVMFKIYYQTRPGEPAPSAPVQDLAVGH